jgi:hypothetical protein
MATFGAFLFFGNEVGQSFICSEKLDVLDDNFNSN